MNTIFRTSENNKTPVSQRLLLNLTDKINYKEKINILHYQILVHIIKAKYKKVMQKTKKFKT